MVYKFINKSKKMDLTHSRRYRLTVYAWQERNYNHFGDYQNEYARNKYHEGAGEIIKRKKRGKYAYDKEAARQRAILLD